MKKQLFILALVLLHPGFAQQHAPTVDVCRADASVWNAAVMNLPERSKAKLSVEELGIRQNEMHDCLTVDKSQPAEKSAAQHHTYQLLEADYTNEIEFRAMRFIRRHGLEQQFLREDAAGAR
jgi:hypothetical protein